jgi:argininosuccinate synthase
MESRVVGIKSREVYECPAATILLTAHKALEALTLPRELLRFKASVDARFAELVYDGQWFTPLREALEAFVRSSQARVTGTVQIKLFKGAAAVVGRDSPYALYDARLATYGAGDAFDAAAAEGFVTLYGLSSKVWAQAGRKRVTSATKGVEAHAVAAVAR